MIAFALDHQLIFEPSLCLAGYLMLELREAETFFRRALAIMKNHVLSSDHVCVDSFDRKARDRYDKMVTFGYEKI